MKIKDLFNTAKYKRKYNTYKLKYAEALESKIKDKEEIIRLQTNLLAAKDEITKLADEAIQLKIKKVKNEKEIR